MPRAAALWLAALAGCSAAPTKPPAKSSATPTSATRPQSPPTRAPAQAGAKPAPALQATPPARTEQVPAPATEPWRRQRDAARTADEVPAARDLLPAVPWPVSIDEAVRAQARELAGKLDPTGGKAHVEAQEALEQLGYPALFAILERLRELDYRDADDAAFGFQLNQLLERVTGGLNTRYAPVEADEQIPPAKAQWNAKTVLTWSQLFSLWPDEAAFARALAARTGGAPRVDPAARGDR